jgi:serine/threonine protein kinase/Tol biopolymer transport system component
VESLLASDGGSLLEKSALDMAAREMAQQDTPSWMGRKIRNYDILALVGAGGMGEVYRARDQSLGRDVALKLLPRELSSDPERTRRLEREARILASFNHANIATLYGLEEHEDQRFLVMELVPGQTLAERLRTGALPITEALNVCRQIAEGLESAHESGVVHRDLKPANVKVTPDGRVKLLDFGLGKALETPGSVLEPTTIVSESTREGMVLGTPAYMSPEQARGQPIDRRTDIWAFGCCVYECLTGRRAFQGNTVTDTLAAVLDKDPDWRALSDAVPPGVRRLLRRCLVKDVRHRLQHIGDARLDLESTEPDERDPRLQPGRFLRLPLPMALGTLFLVLVALGLAFLTSGRRTDRLAERKMSILTLRIEIPGARNVEMPITAPYVPFAISPDGQRVVFRARGTGGSQLYVRELSAFETKPLPGTQGATSPFFSPDGRWVGFWRAEDRILRKVSIDGGSPLEIAPTDVPHVALWKSDGEIILDTSSQDQSVWSIPPGGRTPRPIRISDRAQHEMIWARALMPPGDNLLVASTGRSGSWLEVLSRQTGTRRRLVRAAPNILFYTPTGHLVYAEADALLAVPLDSDFAPLARATPVLHGIDHHHGHANVALSETGTVVYVPADRVREGQLNWLDFAGNVTPVPGAEGWFTAVSLSPNGREAAATVLEGTETQVWIYDLERATKRLLTADNGGDAIWSRDGTFITYRAYREDDAVICQKRADGTGSENCLIERHNFTIPEQWSPDGRSLLFTEYTSRGDTDIWVFANGKATPLATTSSSEASARFSNDGRYIAFTADEGGDSQVYVQPFPGPGPRSTISNEEADEPIWATDGRHLYYRSGKRRMAVEVQTAPVLRIGKTTVLFEASRPSGQLGVKPDARRILTFVGRTMESPPELRVVLNWFDELERLAPHPRR